MTLITVMMIASCREDDGLGENDESGGGIGGSDHDNIASNGAIMMLVMLMLLAVWGS